MLEAESIEEERGRIFTAIINQSLALLRNIKNSFMNTMSILNLLGLNLLREHTCLDCVVLLNTRIIT
jgi:hypothetical protein